jgi:serine protease Do
MLNRNRKVSKRYGLSVSTCRVWAITTLLTMLATPFVTLPARAADLKDVIVNVKRSVVGVGTFVPTRSPATVFTGTGFVVGDGLSIITNSHVVPETSATGEKIERLGIVVPDGNGVRFREAELVARDREHDLAHLRLIGPPLPALALGDSDNVREGQELAFTGYPLGMVLGLHAAHHRAMLASITPAVTPSLTSSRLDARQISALQHPFNIFQLDGTAYPGNSGSPVYDPASGEVWGIVNAVFVKGLKENAISNPSGITYAVPANYVRKLLQRGQG